MWPALRAELAYFRPWLLGGLGIAAGVIALLYVLLSLFGEGEGVPWVLPVIFPIIAGMVVSFIAQSYRHEEHRARLLLATPLTLRQLAGVKVLLPACLVSLGAAAAMLVVGVTALVTGDLGAETSRLLGILSGQFFGFAQMGPLVEEAVAARRQGRGGASLAGWLALILLFCLLTSLYWAQGRPGLSVLGHLAVLSMIMTVTVVLYQGRTDFIG